MHNRQLIMVICLHAVATVPAVSDDAGAPLFDDTRIHAYELQFYCADWADSLKYYKNLPDEEYLPARLVYHSTEEDSIVLDSIGVRYKGNSSYNFAANSPKKPFKFRLDKYRSGQTLHGVKRLNFANGAKDPTLLREKIAYDIIGRLMPAPRACHATISINGNLIGLYTQIEQVDKTFLARHYKDNDFNLFKACDNGSSLLYKGVSQSAYKDEYELKTNESVNDWSAFIGMLDKLNSTPAGEFTRVVGACLDLDNICRYLAFNMVLSNFDSYTGSGRNFYLYDDSSTQKFTLIPWDLNLAFGTYTNNWNVHTCDIATVSNATSRPLNARILAHDSLRQVYFSHIRHLIENEASPDSVGSAIERLRHLIEPLVQADSFKLHSYADFIRNMDDDVTVLDGLSRSTIPGLRSFLTRRSENLRTQLAAHQASATPLHTAREPVMTLRCIHASRTMINICPVVPPGVSDVEITIFDARGLEVSRITDQHRDSTMRYQWNTTGIAPGWFMVRLRAGRQTLYTSVPVLH